MSVPSSVLIERIFQTHSTSALADFNVKIKERVVLHSTTIHHSHNLPTLSLPLYFFNRPQSTLTGHGRLFSYNSYLKESSLRSRRDTQSKPTHNIEVTPSPAVLTILLPSLAASDQPSCLSSEGVASASRIISSSRVRALEDLGLITIREPVSFFLTVLRLPGLLDIRRHSASSNASSVYGLTYILSRPLGFGQQANAGFGATPNNTGGGLFGGSPNTGFGSGGTLQFGNSSALG